MSDSLEQELPFLRSIPSRPRAKIRTDSSAQLFEPAVVTVDEYRGYCLLKPVRSACHKLTNLLREQYHLLVFRHTVINEWVHTVASVSLKLLFCQ